MKKLIVTIGVIGTLLFVGKVMAGVPTDQMSQSRTSYIVPPASTSAPSAVTYPLASNWNTIITTSIVSASGAATTVALPVSQTTMTFTNGVSNSTFSARICITDITANLSSNSTFYLLDGATTSYVVYGAANLPFSGAAASVWTKHWDHLGPWCGTAGNTATLLIPIPGVATVLNAISVDGYTVITGLASIYNVGQ